MIYFEQVHEDVGCMYGWYGSREEYRKMKLPKIPLLVAVLTEDQSNVFHSTLLQDKWKEVGWYPGCHQELDDAYRVILYSKVQDVPLMPAPRQPAYAPAPRDFNDYMLVGCSCTPTKRMRRIGPPCDRHATIGLHRKVTKTKLKNHNNWHRFADTPLASYWFWGLLPNETDRHKYEK